MCEACLRRDMKCSYAFDSPVPTPEFWPGQKCPLVLTEEGQSHGEHDLELLHHFWTQVMMNIMPDTHARHLLEGVLSIALTVRACIVS